MPASKGTLNASRRKEGMSGLQGRRRAKARKLAKKAALGGVDRAAAIHYTQDSRRWQGIDKKLNPFDGEYPAYADCSSYTTWVLWAVLVHHYGFNLDIVNHESWQGGYTGTQVDNGKLVKHRMNWRSGDLIFYGDQGGGVPKHVAMYVGNGMVVSHGSEGAPYLVPWDYRDDFAQCRRYI